ncbi:hypothetical protein MPER_07638 [Moniliophthora perniciosa FA553]|nr:hypothetical protein MPER_07638 [Moniliophthora perniciosa FA553]
MTCIHTQHFHSRSQPLIVRTVLDHTPFISHHKGVEPMLCSRSRT